MKSETLAASAEESRRRLLGRPRPAAVPLQRRTRVSFEFFPPQPDVAGRFDDTVSRLARLDPAFMSVTYGAGGTSRDRTLRTLGTLAASGSAPIAGHLTCVGADRGQTDSVVDAYLESGVTHIVALRGDPPEGSNIYRPHPSGYRNAADLVAGIRRRNGAAGNMTVSVAAYPEGHPDSGTQQADLDNLKRKFDAGADNAITQFFFDPEVFLRFRERARAAGISAPIIPGILPVTNFRRVVEFAARCGASVPGWMAELFQGLDHNPEIRQLVAATVTAELCTRLRDHGVSDFHFYTLNRPELTQAICHIMGIREPEVPTAAMAAAGS